MAEIIELIAATLATAPAGTGQVLTGGTRTGRVRSPGRD